VIRLKIREIAEAKKVSQRQLSLRSGVDDRTIHRIWMDPYRNIETITLDKIAKVLGVDASELIESVPDEA
jgi:DNA-binding Xre family transcriptional regulator